MKKIFSIIGAFLAGAMMFSCADQYDESAPLGTTISVNPTSLEMDGKAAPEKTVSITCDGMWMAQADEWITVEPMTGEGDTTVTVKVADNMDPAAPEELDAPRKGTITFAVGKENTIVVEVAQAGDPEKAAKKLPFEAPFKAEGQGKFKVENSESTTLSVWSYDDRYGMKASAFFDNANHAAESYLVSPVLDLTSESNAALTFDHAGKYWGADMAAEGAVVVREEGGKWGDALTIPQHATEGWTFVNSGEISLKDYVGKKVQVAFRYVSSNDAAATWEIDNVKFYNPDTTSGETPEPEPEPDPEIATSTFGAITEAGDYKVENATVVAVTTKGYLLYDTTGYAYVYVGSKTDYAVGTQMTVTGAVTYYYGMMQIAPSAVENVTTVEVTHPEAEVVDGAAIDAYMSAPTYKYVKVTGKLSVGNYTNLSVEGTANTVSVSYYDGDLSSLNEKDVTLYGYLGGSNTKNSYATMYLVSYEEVAAEGGDDTTEVTAYTMTLGVTVGEDSKYAPNANIDGLAKSFKEHTWTATDDSGKDTITFSGNVYYRDGDATVWYFNKKNPGTTVSAEGFGKLKKITITLLGTSKRLPALFECKDKEGNVVAANETEKSLTMTYEFANATDGFTLTGKNDVDAEDSNYAQDLKVTSVVIEYEK